MTKVGPGFGVNVQFVLIGDLIGNVRTGGTVLYDDVIRGASIVLGMMVGVVNIRGNDAVGMTIFQHVPFGNVQALIVLRHKHRQVSLLPLLRQWW